MNSQKLMRGGLGLLFIIVGALIIAYVSAFATMINPDTKGWHWWITFFSKLFSPREFLGPVLGIFLVLTGILILVRGLGRQDQKA